MNVASMLFLLGLLPNAEQSEANQKIWDSLSDAQQNAVIAQFEAEYAVSYSTLKEDELSNLPRDLAVRSWDDMRPDRADTEF
jgi:hypothetical protein